MNREFYPTDNRATKFLLSNWNPCGMVVEPCCGKGHISKILRDSGYSVWDNDIDLVYNPKTSYDIRSSDEMDTLKSISKAEILITNSPFSLAYLLLRNVIDLYDQIALYLPINFLEPTEERWIGDVREPDRIIILPRMSHTEDGFKDKKTCFWGIWDLDIRNSDARIKIIPQSKLSEYGDKSA